MTPEAQLGSGLLRALVQQGLIPAASASAVEQQAQQSGSLLRAAVARLSINWTQAAQVVADAFNHPVLHLPSLSPSLSVPLNKPQVAELVGLEVWPLAVRNGRLTVATADPSDLLRLQQVSRIANLPVIPVTVAADALLQRLQAHVTPAGEASAARLTENANSSPGSAPADTGTIDRFLGKYAMQAIQKGSDNLHLEADPSGLRLRIREGGHFVTLAQVPEAVGDLLIQGLQQRAHWDLKSPGGQDIRFDIHTLNTTAGPRLLLSRSASSSQTPKLPDLGFSGEQVDMLTQTLSADPIAWVAIRSASRRLQLNCLLALAQLEDSTAHNVFLLSDAASESAAGCTQLALQDGNTGHNDALLQDCLLHDPSRLLIAGFDVQHGTRAQRMALQWAVSGGRRLYAGLQAGAALELPHAATVALVIDLDPTGRHHQIQRRAAHD